MKPFIIVFFSLYATLSPGAPTFVPTENRTVIYNGMIDGRAAQVGTALAQLVITTPRDQPIDIMISSDGGLVQEGQALIGAIDFAVKAGVRVRCLNLGRVASMGFMIFMHCSERFTLIDSTFLFHYPSITPQGQPFVVQSLLDTAADLKLTEDLFVHDLEYYLHVSEQDVRDHCKAETEWTVDQLNEFSPGFVTVVSGIQGVTIRSLFK